MVKKLTAAAIIAALVSTGCASGGGPRVQAAPERPVDTSFLADYVRQIPAGSKVRVERTNGGTLRGTLMKASVDSIVVQKGTRIPEPPVEIPLAQVTRVSLDSGSSSVGKAIAIGIASGLGATLAFIAILAAAWD